MEEMNIHWEIAECKSRIDNRDEMKTKIKHVMNKSQGIGENGETNHSQGLWQWPSHSMEESFQRQSLEEVVRKSQWEAFGQKDEIRMEQDGNVEKGR